MAGRTELAAGVAVGGLAVVLITTACLVRRGLDRRRMAAWDADWLANGPRWSPRR
jgi:peptidoglycan biosynthesis protein MviN/MurJ (putative lipid II flippase)